MSRAEETPATEPFDGSSAADRLAARLLNGPMAAILGLVCVAEFASWAPNYLTWPFWADHDVFATAALGWSRGVLPYREFVGNNFPGTIYIFLAIGKLFGPGWIGGPAFYGFDACLVALFGLILVGWSRRVLGSRLAGVVAIGAFLGYYLNLDYSVAAQRDWQGPVLATIGLLLVPMFPGRGGRIVAGFLCAFGMVIRPQTALLLPAVAWAVASEARRADRSRVAALAEWSLAVAAGLGLGAWPLISAGIWPDFLASLKVVSFGSNYNNKSPGSFLTALFVQFLPIRLAIVPLALACLLPGADRELARVARPWLVAFAGVAVYAPISPHSHAYLAHPIFVVWAGLVAVLAEVVRRDRGMSAARRLVLVLLMVGLGTPQKPRFCNPVGSLRAWPALKTRAESVEQPTGYLADIGHAVIGQYAWEDYRATLDYLRRTTAPATRIANALEKLPALTGPAGRSSAFPAESIAWLRVVREGDEGRFADSLRAAEDSVVVWSPPEVSKPGLRPLPLIHAAIRELYEPDARFGPIEVWRRKGRPR